MSSDVDGGGKPVADLGGTLRKGAAISAVALVAVQFVSFLQTLVIARILSPAEVGLFAAGTVLTAFLVTFSEGGLRNALVQRDEDDLADAADTVFWATLSFGVVWAAAAAAAAPLVAWAFDSPTAGWVAFAASGTVILHSLTNVPDSLLQRRFDFRQRWIVRPGTAISFAAVSVTFCALGFGVWGLVIGSYASQLTWVVSTWWLAGWRPGRGRPTVRLWRELAGFGFPLVLGTIADRAHEAVETTIVGAALSPAALGQYKYGRRLGDLPGTAIIEIGSYVLFPAFSRIAGDVARLRAAMLRALGAIWCLAAPAAGLVIAVGQPAVVIMLGEPWRGAGLLFVAMAGAGPGVALCAVGMESIKGCGRTRLLNWITGYSLVVGLALLVALLPLGLLGLGLAVSITSVSSGVLSLLLARGLVQLSVREILAPLVPATVAAAVPAVLLGFAEALFVHADQHGVLLGVLILLAEALAFAVVYLGLLRTLAPALVKELVATVRRDRKPAATAG